MWCKTVQLFRGPARLPEGHEDVLSQCEEKYPKKSHPLMHKAMTSTLAYLKSFHFDPAAEKYNNDIVTREVVGKSEPERLIHSHDPSEHRQNMDNNACTSSSAVRSTEHPNAQHHLFGSVFARTMQQIVMGTSFVASSIRHETPRYKQLEQNNDTTFCSGLPSMTNDPESASNNQTHTTTPSPGQISSQ